MNEHDVLKKNRNFYIGVAGTVLEGFLSGSLFLLLYSAMQFLWDGHFDMNQALTLTSVIAVILCSVFWFTATAIPKHRSAVHKSAEISGFLWATI